jgi:hypothetical protein
MSPTLTLTVSDRQVRASTSGGGAAQGEYAFGGLQRQTVEILVDWLARNGFRSAKEFQVLGSHLYVTLFVPAIDQFFRDRLDALEGTDRLLVKLTFEETAQDLARLPWEYLYMPEQEGDPGAFLSTAGRLVLARSLAVDHEDLTVDDDGPLRVLVAVPEGANGDGVPAEFEALRTALARYEDRRWPLEITTTVATHIDDFLTGLPEPQPHVLHFIGRGRVNRSGEGQVALRTAEGSPDWMRDDDFADLFPTRHWIPKLVLLQLCESGAAPSGSYVPSFATVGPRLLKRQIPAVAAMQYPIENHYATRFSQKVYLGLAKGEDLDAAVQQARAELAYAEPKYDGRMFGAPALYTRASGRIVAPPTPSEETDRGSGSTSIRRSVDRPQGTEQQPGTTPTVSRGADPLVQLDPALIMFGTAARTRAKSLNLDEDAKTRVFVAVMKLESDLDGMEPGARIAWLFRKIGSAADEHLELAFAAFAAAAVANDAIVHQAAPAGDLRAFAAGIEHLVLAAARAVSALDRATHERRYAELHGIIGPLVGQSDVTRIELIDAQLQECSEEDQRSVLAAVLTEARKRLEAGE